MDLSSNLSQWINSGRSLARNHFACMSEMTRTKRNLSAPGINGCSDRPVAVLRRMLTFCLPETHGGEGSRTPVLRRHCGNVYIHVLPLMLIVAPRAGKRASLRLFRLKSRSMAAEEP